MAAHLHIMERLVAQFESNPLAVRKSLIDSWSSNTQRFLEAAVPILCRNEESPGQKYLVSFLLQNGNLAEKLSDVDQFTKEEAASIARLAVRVDPSLDMKLAVKIANTGAADKHQSQRLLEILEAISNPSNLLPLLASVIRHPDAKVRSKAALLMGKGNRNPAWVEQQLREPDSRVRANAVESLWGTSSPEAVSAFEMAIQDNTARVVANAALGLYLAHQTSSIEILSGATTNPEHGFRASFAWAMGRTQDPRFLAPLSRLVRDPDARTRSNALRSIARIRNYQQTLEKLPPLSVPIAATTLLPSGQRQLSVAIRQAGRSQPITLPPLSFVIDEDGTQVLHYEVDHVTKADSFPLGLVLPSSAELPPDLHASLLAACQLGLTLKSASAPWSAAAYTNLDDPEVTPPTPVFQTLPAFFDESLQTAFRKPNYGFLPALGALASSAPKGDRTIVVIGSTHPECAGIVFYRNASQQKWIDSLIETKTTVHAIVPKACPPMMRLALADFVSATGGAFYSIDSAEALLNQLSTLLASVHPNYKLRYTPASPSATSVKLLVHSPLGLGTHTASL